MEGRYRKICHRAEGLTGLGVTSVGRPDDKSSRKVDLSLTYASVFEQPSFPNRNELSTEVEIWES